MDFFDYFTNVKEMFSLSKPAGIVWFCFEVAFLVLAVFGLWKVFVKMDQPGWKALIPFYNLYVICKLCWNKKFFFYILAFSILSAGVETTLQFLQQGSVASKILMCFNAIFGIALLVYDIILANKISKAFGHKVGYTLGLIFLPQLFLIILGFDDSKFVVNENKNESNNIVE